MYVQFLIIILGGSSLEKRQRQNIFFLLTLAKLLHRAQLQLGCVFCARCECVVLSNRSILCRVSQSSTTNKKASSRKNAFNVFLLHETFSCVFITKWSVLSMCYRKSSKQAKMQSLVASSTVFVLSFWCYCQCFVWGRAVKYIFHYLWRILKLCVCVSCFAESSLFFFLLVWSDVDNNGCRG